MTGTLARLLGDVPVEPDRGQARRWAEQELAGREYAAARPSLIRRFTAWLLDQLFQLRVPKTAGSALLTALLAGVVVVILILVATAVWRSRGGSGRGARRAKVAVLSGPARTAADHRSAAQAHADAGRWAQAILERFRAVARELVERAVLDPQPGRTADEVAGQAARWLPDLAGVLTGGARAFDDVAYGDRPGRAEAYQQLVALDEGVQRARPLPAPGTAAPALVPPR